MHLLWHTQTLYYIITPSICNSSLYVTEFYKRPYQLTLHNFLLKKNLQISYRLYSIKYWEWLTNLTLSYYSFMTLIPFAKRRWFRRKRDDFADIKWSRRKKMISQTRNISFKYYLELAILWNSDNIKISLYCFYCSNINYIEERKERVTTSDVNVNTEKDKRKYQRTWKELNKSAILIYETGGRPYKVITINRLKAQTNSCNHPYLIYHNYDLILLQSLYF